MRIPKRLLVSGLVFCFLLGATIGCTRDKSITVELNTTDKTEFRAFDRTEITYLGQAAASIAADHGGESGFLLMDRGRDALSWRTILADAAEKSIDAQYFLWKNDDAGKIMMQRLLAAADRGVRVRVLIDDSMTESNPHYLALFGAHPEVELRLYKPFGPRHKSLVVRWIDYVADLSVLNRRMHNKLFLVDGSVAIVGGRNIGNEYFEYPGPLVFRSRDLLALGPVVDTLYFAAGTCWRWGPWWILPVKPSICTGTAIGPCPSRMSSRRCRHRKRPGSNKSASTRSLPTSLTIRRDSTTIRNRSMPRWPGSARSFYGVLPCCWSMPFRIRMASCRRTKSSTRRVSRSPALQVKLSTNSMASNNHLTAFVGYAKQRKRMLDTGAELYEMRTDARSEQALFDTAQLEEQKTIFGLHAKTTVFDRKITFVGSFNVDPRSENLNT